VKLPVLAKPLELAEQLAEFDIWITPSLGEIRDTERFQRELDAVVAMFDVLASSTKNFKGVDDCSPEAITNALLTLVDGKPMEDAASVLQSAASLLFLSTGKSDNNAKCQLPLHLRDAAKWATYPTLRPIKGTITVAGAAIPRVLKSEKYMSLVAHLSSHREEQKRLLLEFVRFVLSDEKYVAQLWSIGHSYTELKAFRHERDLLTPLVIFQVRGSVSASGGHAPERILRERFHEWGLVKGVDYNLIDVKSDGDDGVEAKTRAYDFVLPYKTVGWSQRMFIQSQFYAGDSGSVSHKNIDQTKTSRSAVLEKVADAIFVEYVDGAGYFASLKGDLKRLLTMPTTHSFAQVRSTPIRIRRVLQEIGFLTPLEVEHAVARTDGSVGQVTKLLIGEGYKSGEVKRCFAHALEVKAIDQRGGKFTITRDRREIARRYLLLDTVAFNGVVLASSGSSAPGYLMVSGYGPLYGIKLVDLLAKATVAAPGFARDFADSKVLLEDVQWLEERRFLMSS
jgi:hypothetical protein